MSAGNPTLLLPTLRHIPGNSSPGVKIPPPTSPAVYYKQDILGLCRLCRLFITGLDNKKNKIFIKGTGSQGFLPLCFLLQKTPMFIGDIGRADIGTFVVGLKLVEYSILSDIGLNFNRYQITDFQIKVSLPGNTVLGSLFPVCLSVFMSMSNPCPCP